MGAGTHGDRLGWLGPRLPSEATLRRALRELDLGTLEDCLMQIRPATESPKPGRWQGHALEGKALRGARAHDRPIHLLGLVSHQGRVLAQLAVAEHANENTPAPLAGWPDAAGHGQHAGCRADPVVPGGADSGARGPLSDGGQGQSTDPASAGSSIRSGKWGSQRRGPGWRGRWTRDTAGWRSGPWKATASWGRG